tara:strand:+ start:46 stop:1434 length:1389 start_codon:yes stop_codon:yes gene_type:complete
MPRNDPYSYTIDKVNIYVHGRTSVINVAGSLLELELEEDIDNLHVMGSLSFLDTNNVFENIDFNGTEYMQISGYLPDSPSDRWSRWFHVQSVMKAQKGNDTSEAFTLSIIDRDSFWNNAINVNKSYAGKITLMMDNILRDNFQNNKRLLFGSQDVQEPILYIPPNLTPYQTLKVLRDRCTGAAGTPFYLYAAANDNRLRFFDLMELLDIPAINEGRPYIYNQRSQDTGGVNETAYHIADMDITDTENMMDTIRKGYVGAEYQYVNTTGGYVDIVKYDAQKVVSNIWKYSSAKSLAPNINANATIGGSYLTDLTSTVHSYTTSSNVYNDFASIDEDLTNSFHRSRSISKALKHYMDKSAISIRVPGRNFFPSQKCMTIGNKIEIDILSNNDLRKGMSSSELKDQKRSGKYIILSSRHHFVNNRYSVDLTIGKLGNKQGNTTASRYGDGFGQVDRSIAKAAGLI